MLCIAYCVTPFFTLVITHTVLCACALAYVCSQVSRVAGWITPVPGGVGPMTVAMLMRNTLKAAASQRGPT